MKAIILLALLAVFSRASSVPRHSLTNEDLNEMWKTYKINYDKKYEEIVEEFARRLIWEENLKYIQEHNIRYFFGHHTYFLGVNQFTDLTHDEFKAKYLRELTQPGRIGSITYLPPMNTGPLPVKVNWTSKGYVTPVKNQGQCGSCWSFSTTGAMEGQYRRKYNRLSSFSEQQLVDCSQAFGPLGCNGGWMDDAFRYIANYGLETELSYPYTARGGICRYNPGLVVNGTKVQCIVDIKTGDEKNLANAVATQGPVAVAIDASHPSFQSYKGGIYNEPTCTTFIQDHAVLAVGYDDSTPLHYWIVKNSWSASWGLSGYILMSKDKNNQCGIASHASFPLL